MMSAVSCDQQSTNPGGWRLKIPFVGLHWVIPLIWAGFLFECLATIEVSVSAVLKHNIVPARVILPASVAIAGLLAFAVLMTKASRYVIIGLRGEHEADPVHGMDRQEYRREMARAVLLLLWAVTVVYVCVGLVSWSIDYALTGAARIPSVFAHPTFVLVMLVASIAVLEVSLRKSPAPKTCGSGP